MWKKEDVDLMLDLLTGGKSYKEISLIVNKTEGSIRSKSHKLGYKSSTYYNSKKSKFQCKECNIEFEDLIERGRVFCSQSCNAKFNNRKRKYKYKSKCIFCNKEIKSKKYCSKECQFNNDRNIIFDKSMKTNDAFGDRMKLYESQTTGIKLIPRIPVIARLDGKGFSKFTKGLKRPYDERLSKLMVETVKYLVKETNANCGYTQSDEITLMWYTDKIDALIYFDGRLFKMLTDLSAMASVFFNRKLSEYLPEKADKMPRFDCRVYNVPTLDEAVNSFLWREQDATKNSISMAAQHYYSHKDLMNKNGSDKQEMLFQKGVNWNDYPTFFKRGTYVQRKRIVNPFTVEEIENLPAKHNARSNPNYVIERWVIDTVELPKLSSIENSVEVIVFGQEPKLKV